MVHDIKLIIDKQQPMLIGRNFVKNTWINMVHDVKARGANI